MFPSIIYSDITHPTNMSHSAVTIYRLGKSISVLVLKHVPISGRVIANLKELSIDVIAGAKAHRPWIYNTTDLSSRPIIKDIRNFIIHDNFSIQEFLSDKRILKVKCIRVSFVHSKIGMNKILIGNLIHKHMSATTTSYKCSQIIHSFKFIHERTISCSSTCSPMILPPGIWSFWNSTNS